MTATCRGTGLVVSGLCVALLACGPSEQTGAGGDGGGEGEGGGGEFEPRPDAEVCEDSVEARSTIRRPDVVLVVDRSSSMGYLLNGLGSLPRWHVMRNSLRDLLTARAGDVRFGLAAFPVDNDCGAGAVQVMPADDSAGAIEQLLAGLEVQGKTPITGTLRNVRTHFAGTPVNPDGRYVVLATDGIPICGPPIPGQDVSPDVDGAIAAVSELAADGIATYVLGFALDTSGASTTLQQLAAAGGTDNFYEATTPDELAQAFDAIAGEVREIDCAIRLEARPKDPSQIVVSFDGMAIEDSAWRYDSATNTIIVQGARCGELESGSIDQVEIDFGCAGVIVE